MQDARWIASKHGSPAQSGHLAKGPVQLPLPDSVQAQHGWLSGLSGRPRGLIIQNPTTTRQLWTFKDQAMLAVLAELKTDSVMKMHSNIHR